MNPENETAFDIFLISVKTILFLGIINWNNIRKNREITIEYIIVANKSLKLFMFIEKVLKNSTGKKPMNNPNKRVISPQNKPWPLQVIIFISTSERDSKNKYIEYPKTPVARVNKYRLSIGLKFSLDIFKLLVFILLF